MENNKFKEGLKCTTCNNNKEQVKKLSNKILNELIDELDVDENEQIRSMLEAASYASDLARYLGNSDPDLAESLVLLELNEGRISNSEEKKIIEETKKKNKEVGNITKFALNVGFKSPDEIKSEGLDVLFADMIRNSKLNIGNKFDEMDSTLLYINEIAKFNVCRNSREIIQEKEEK